MDKEMGYEGASYARGLGKELIRTGSLIAVEGFEGLLGFGLTDFRVRHALLRTWVKSEEGSFACTIETLKGLLEGICHFMVHILREAVWKPQKASQHGQANGTVMIGIKVRQHCHCNSTVGATYLSLTCRLQRMPLLAKAAITLSLAVCTGLILQPYNGIKHTTAW